MFRGILTSANLSADTLQNSPVFSNCNSFIIRYLPLSPLESDIWREKTHKPFRNRYLQKPPPTTISTLKPLFDPSSKLKLHGTHPRSLRASGQPDRRGRSGGAPCLRGERTARERARRRRHAHQS